MDLKPFTKVIALVDCNNFFVSCERVFRPDLHKQPVAVLSNNDGCFIARSQEVKELGIPMAAPLFKHRETVEKNKVILFSANFTLYGEISRRIMQTLKKFSPSVQVYSIDEAFLDLSFIPQKDLQKYGHKMAKYIYKSIGVPVSIGIAPTKTLSKLMSEQAKKNHQQVSSYYDYSQSQLEQIYSKTLTREIWGVGYKKSKKLEDYKIHTVQDLLNSNQSFIRKNFTVVSERTLLELKGVSCLEMDDVITPKKNILSSRSFGTPITDFASLEESISCYLETASRKLRDQDCQANYLSVFLKTSKFQPDKPELAYKSFSEGINLPYPTNSTTTLLKMAKPLLKEIYKPGVRYKKSGVFLSQLQEKLATQTSFLYNTDEEDASSSLFKQIDRINKQYGKNTVQLGSSGLKTSSWKMRRNHVSPDYLSDWKQIPKVS